LCGGEVMREGLGSTGCTVGYQGLRDRSAEMLDRVILATRDE
jgi:hypothetical protein